MLFCLISLQDAYYGRFGLRLKRSAHGSKTDTPLKSVRCCREEWVYYIQTCKLNLFWSGTSKIAKDLANCAFVAQVLKKLFRISRVLDSIDRQPLQQRRRAACIISHQVGLSQEPMGLA